LNADVNTFERLHIVRDSNSSAPSRGVVVDRMKPVERFVEINQSFEAVVRLQTSC